MTCDICFTDDITTFSDVRVIKQVKSLFGLRVVEQVIPIRLLYHCNKCGCLKFLIEVFSSYTRIYPDTSTYPGRHVLPSDEWDKRYKNPYKGDGYANYISCIQGYYGSKLSTPLRYKLDGDIIYTCSKYRKLNCIHCELIDPRFDNGYYCPMFHQKPEKDNVKYLVKIGNHERVLGFGKS